ncbi:hypothetical protein [Variovorax sp. W6]|uniref:hypothetical protein n=1 Tax=Variovorax sp. W6 TaxID=3093895 RepID=UPI003D808179
MRRNLWWLIGAVLLAGCAPKGLPRPASWTAGTNNGELVIYRPAAFFSDARNAYFYADGVHIASVGANTYSVVSLPPDAYKVTQKWDWDKLMKDLVIDVRVHPKQRSYARLKLTQGALLVGTITESWALEEVPADVGAAEILKLQANAPATSASR